MAENKEVQYLICLNSLNIMHTAPGNYTVPAGTKFKLVSSAEVIVVDIDCHFQCDAEVEKSSLLNALEKDFKNQHFEVNVELATNKLQSDKKIVDVNISIIGESHVTYQDVYDAVSEHLGSSYTLRKGLVKHFIGDITEVDFVQKLIIPKGTIFQAYQPGSTMSFVTQQEATFSPTSDTGTCVYSLNQDIVLKDTTKSIALRLSCCFDINDHEHSKLIASNINTQIQQYLQQYQPFNCYVSVFTLTYKSCQHYPSATSPLSVGLSIQIRNIPKSNQDIALHLQEYLESGYVVSF